MNSHHWLTVGKPAVVTDVANITLTFAAFLEHSRAMFTKMLFLTYTIKSTKQTINIHSWSLLGR